MIERVLKLYVGGRPVSWISREEGALLYCRDQVAWEAGAEEMILRGGISRMTGLRSVLHVNSIVAVTSIDKTADQRAGVPALTNARLFRRDGYLCLYCGDRFLVAELSRDHVTPLSGGGRDVWTNVVTACRRCNNHKAGRTPEQAGMQLLAVPFQPTYAEYIYLKGRRVLADQMEYLVAHFPRTSPLHARLTGLRAT